MKLAGVVVVYNPGDGVLNSINSYIDDLDILYVVDNSSFDNTKLFNNDKIKYIPNMDNMGIAKALNVEPYMLLYYEKENNVDEILSEHD